MTTKRLHDSVTYLKRLGFTAEPPPTLETLATLQVRHTSLFPFETLANFLHMPVPIDLPSLEHKLLHQGRGGYCYELNILFLALLRHLGFDSRPLTARVLLQAVPGIAPARTHFLILITLDGIPYITDVGFGGMVPTGPLRLDSLDEQATPHEPFRLSRKQDQYILQALVAGNWRELYQFDLQEQNDIDFVVGNWFISTHPESPFLDQLIAARTGPGLRKTLNNTSFAIHRSGRASERIQLKDADSIIRVLHDDLGISVPQYVDFPERLNKILTPLHPQP
jgi:N-hydroxyarylamine O-acetyltransferase